jgi:hypothetical protein
LEEEMPNNKYRFNKVDDDFYSFLTEDVPLVGDPEIPMMMDLNNIFVPRGLVAYEKIDSDLDYRKHVHFYIYDSKFKYLIANIKSDMKKFRLRDGVITPDYSLISNRSISILHMQTFFSRAVGCYLQKNGISVIPNVRWCDERTYDFCFLGIPEGTIVSISTLGCIKTKLEKEYFVKGLSEMLIRLQPTDVVVYGSNSDCLFERFQDKTKFHFYESLIEEAHSKDGLNGN